MNRFPVNIMQKRPRYTRINKTKKKKKRCLFILFIDKHQLKVGRRLTTKQKRNKILLFLRRFSKSINRKNKT